MSDYDVERVEALLRERAHGLTRTPFGSRRSPTPAPPETLAPTVTVAPEPLEPAPPEPPAHTHIARGGSCVACARPIGLGRLRAVPDAVRCIECQFAFEAGSLTPHPARA